MVRAPFCGLSTGLLSKWEMLTLTNLYNENPTWLQQHFIQGKRDSVFGRHVSLSVLSDNPLADPSLDIALVPVPQRVRFA